MAGECFTGVRRRTRWWRRQAAIALLLFACWVRSASADDVDWAQLQREATSFLTEYIQLDTTNPPGKEIGAAQFVAAFFRGHGIEAKVFESEAARGSILARLQGGGKGRPVVLLNHLDVVPADPEGWAHPPFAGIVEDGYVYGRGALDCKGMAVVQAMAVIALKRSGIPLGRDVIFLGTADEEVGGQLGAGWFVREHLPELDEPEFVLNEGGSIRAAPDGKLVYEVAIVEKTPFWLRLIATGQPGHGSTPRGESAVTRLIRALDRIERHQLPVRVVPEVQAYYRALAEQEEGAKRERYRDLRTALTDAAFRDEFLRRPEDAALVRNTISPTVLSASNKTNVIPARASAELDVRLLPDESPDGFLRELRSVVGDDNVEFAVLLNFPPSSSGADTALYRVIQQVAADEGATVVPNVLRGFTDSHYFREKGVTSYGFVPVTLSDEETERMHGIDERISVQNLGEGPRRLLAILRALDETGAVHAP